MKKFLLLSILALPFFLTGCPDKKPKYPNCTTDQDCKENQFCIDRSCVECSKDSHCNSGETCEDNVCVKPECTQDNECDEGKICKNNKCQACKKNSDCGPGGTCNEGICKKPTSCEIDEDCADDEDCIDGTCQKPWKEEVSSTPPCDLKTIFFGFDEYTVPPEGRDIADENAECIKKATNLSVTLMGYTDNRGPEEYNIALSGNRANSVANYLVRIGISRSRFKVVPKGESGATGTDEESYQEDRRVEFLWGK